jgi:hypothetical protein
LQSKTVGNCALCLASSTKDIMEEERAHQAIYPAKPLADCRENKLAAYRACKLLSCGNRSGVRCAPSSRSVNVRIPTSLGSIGTTLLYPTRMMVSSAPSEYRAPHAKRHERAFSHPRGGFASRRPLRPCRIFSSLLIRPSRSRAEGVTRTPRQPEGKARSTCLCSILPFCTSSDKVILLPPHRQAPSRSSQHARLGRYT